MRYAAMVSFAETSDYGPHHILRGIHHAGSERDCQTKRCTRLAAYIYSLRPPPNPNPVDERAVAGQKIFARESCARLSHAGRCTTSKQTDPGAGL